MDYQKVKIVCPYCGHPNYIRFRLTDSRMQLILCDIDDGPGCDRHFVADIALEPKVATYRIHGPIVHLEAQ